MSDRRRHGGRKILYELLGSQDDRWRAVSNTCRGSTAARECNHAHGDAQGHDTTTNCHDFCLDRDLTAHDGSRCAPLHTVNRIRTPGRPSSYHLGHTAQMGISFLSR